jgi:glyoxylase-like metal-dependent hydrolase (beta-lactamase superfamily II)
VPAAAEPQPATLPLPGGKPGATVKVHPITTGTTMYPVDALFTTGGRLAFLHFLGFRSERVEIPIPCFLLEHPTAGPVLVDTGHHASMAVDPKGSYGPILGRAVAKTIRMGEGDALPDQLRARGVDPGDVKLVVMTHLHIDHASGVSQFPQATFVVTRREWDAATDGPGLKGGYVSRQFDHAFDWRTIDFDGDDVNSYKSFGRTLDLLGDGSIRLAYTPGHTLGHMSVVIRTAGPEFLVVGDAAYTMRTIRENAMPYGPHDEHEFRRSLKEVQLYLDQTPDAAVCPGHDLEAFRALKPAY